MSYTPYEWHNGEIITDDKLNHIEQGIAGMECKIKILTMDYSYLDGAKVFAVPYSFSTGGPTSVAAIDGTLPDIHNGEFPVLRSISSGSNNIRYSCSVPDVYYLVHVPAFDPDAIARQEEFISPISSYEFIDETDERYSETTTFAFVEDTNVLVCSITSTDEDIYIIPKNAIKKIVIELDNGPN